MNGYQFTGNAFTHNGNVDVTPPCFKHGFKNSQSRKVWHGARDYFTNATSGKDCETDTDYSDTRYLTVTFTDLVSRLEVTGGNLAEDYDFTGSGTISVGKNSGLLAIDLTLAGVKNVWSGTGGYITTRTDVTGNGAGTITDYTVAPPVVTNYPDSLTTELDSLIGVSYRSCDGLPIDPLNLDTLDAFVSYFNARYASDPNFVALDTVTDLDSYSDSTSFVYTDTGDTVSCALSWTRTATSLTWSLVFVDGGSTQPPMIGTWTFEGTITFSNAYTIQDCHSDTQTLSDEIDLGDDNLYPYRTDGNSFIAPLVIYNEVQSVVDPSAWAINIAWNDPNATAINGATGVVYSDDIIGALLPIGYGQGSPRGVWNFIHRNFYQSHCGAPPVLTIGFRSTGKQTPSYLPAGCGLWTQDERFIATITENLMWPCPFVVANNDGIYLQKWVETLIPPPDGSYNAARPYGYDRFRIDETQAYCFDGAAIRDVDNNLIVSTTFSGVWGGESVGGFYTGCTSDGSGVLTLGTKILDVPTGWTVPSGDTVDVFAKLRWTTSVSNIPGFGGKLNVTASFSAGETTFTYTSSPYIVDGDKISVMGFGDSVLGTNLTITRLGDTSCKVTGDYSTALWIVPYKLFDGTTDGTKYYLANDTHKGTFVARTWILEMDGWTEVDSTVDQSCIAFSNCAPQLLIATPNTETGDYEIDWPTTIDPNTVWIGEFMQWMVDPFYQSPHDPICGGAPAPDQSCLVPYVEARTAVGTNYGAAQNETAPTPPSPINLGATLAAPANAEIEADGYIIDNLNNPTKPWPIWVACGYE